MLLGITPDILTLLMFMLCENFYYLLHDTNFPSESIEALAYLVGKSESVGNQFIYKGLTTETRRIFYVSEMRSAKSAPFPNKRAERHWWEQRHEDDNTPQVVKERLVTDGSDVENHATIEFNPEEIIGRNFLTPIDS
jgi:hypothetical protein